MNRVLATVQRTDNASEARFRHGAALKRASWDEDTTHCSEDNGVEQLQVVEIEWTVYENRIVADRAPAIAPRSEDEASTRVAPRRKLYIPSTSGVAAFYPPSERR
jgi:hypothetical protein